MAENFTSADDRMHSKSSLLNFAKGFDVKAARLSGKAEELRNMAVLIDWNDIKESDVWAIIHAVHG